MISQEGESEVSYYEGMGCKCMARYQGDCACDDVDWTPKEVYQLRYKIEELEDDKSILNSYIDKLEADIREYEENQPFA